MVGLVEQVKRQNGVDHPMQMWLRDSNREEGG